MSDPLDPQKLMDRASQAAARLDYAVASDILFKLPPGPERDPLLARCLRNSGRPHDALKLLEAHWQTVVAAASERGLTQLSLGHAEQAAESFQKARELGGSLDAIHGLAVIEEGRTRGRGDRSQVYTLLCEGLEAYPDDPMLLQTLGVARFYDGEIQTALELFQRVAQARAEVPYAGTKFEVEAHGNLACGYLALGDQDRALDHVEQAMQVCPQWLRKRMSMQMSRDEDLAPLRGHPRFIAAMRTRQ